MDYYELKDMVQAVNDTQVVDYEILEYSIYRYTKSTHELSVIK